MEQSQLNALTDKIIGAALNVHRALGPGLLESAYEACLAYELAESGLGIEQQKPLPLNYRGVHLDCGYRLDLLVENTVIVEIKAVQALEPVHRAQILSYLKARAQARRSAHQLPRPDAQKWHPTRRLRCLTG